MGAKKKTLDVGLPRGVVQRDQFIVLEDGTRLEHKDACHIDGDKDSRARYVFHHVDTYENGNRGAMLYGGPPGHAMFREVGADRVITARKRQKAASRASTPASSQPAEGGFEDRRRALGVSRTVVAEASGLTVPTIATLERGGTPRDGSAQATLDGALKTLEAAR